MVEHLFTQQSHLVQDCGDGFEVGAARQPRHKRDIMALDPLPIAGSALLHRCGDELAHIATADGEFLFGAAQALAFGGDILGQEGKFGCAHHKR